ncbi:SUMO-activating enzyme subunit 2-like [Homarus americanus]|uniref:SUMO-activating enzyme subunit 2-like n=1 Tax=Homarus americanus TaxID=6706 RepID=A0A8J5J9J5_HOMAM|nr:SUMO-activating enzyme subunit 2-like [Homarus americanus]
MWNYVFLLHLIMRQILDCYFVYAENYPDAVDSIGRDKLVRDFFANKALPMISVKCSPYHIGSTSLIMGDAAHAMVPFYGQGMNCGMEDCVVFDELLELYNDDLSQVLPAYTKQRNPDAEAIVDLAMYNYIVMRDLVNSKLFLLRKKWDDLLSSLFPRTWTPLYTMVTFTRVRYHLCIANKEWQDRIAEHQLKTSTRRLQCVTDHGGENNMATHIPGIYEENLRNSIKSCKLLVVGAGGIGCELLKNLVLTGFEEIEVIDLDTIDVSNLNRQFLFHKQHVGRSKSEVARESTYGVPFYQKFTVVMNALDNRAARNHVNRMCLAAGVPLVESGTAGYLGQVTVIQKGLTECYECQPKPTQKTFPGCTIRNTPSEPIHCIVGEAGQSALDDAANDTGNVERVSTRGWATSHDYNSKKLFSKLFSDDIQYLLSMDKLWEKRRRPTPLDWDKIQDKAMAGNIVPAIATTNAIIAGLIRLLVPCVLDKPNPKCYVCSEKPELCVRLNIEKTTVRTLEDKILKSALNMVAPDVEISDGKGTILISSEEGETEANSDKMLKEFNVVDGTRLNCDDFLQNYTLMVNLIHSDKLEDGVEFEVIGNPDELKKAQEEQAKMDTDAGDSSNGPAGAGASSAVPSDDENDLVCLDDEQDAAKKRKIEEDEERKPAKKLRSATPDDDDIIIL